MTTARGTITLYDLTATAALVVVEVMGEVVVKGDSVVVVVIGALVLVVVTGATVVVVGTAGVVVVIGA